MNRMSHHLRPWTGLAMALGLLILAGECQAQISIVVSKSSPRKLTVEDARAIFAAVKTTWPDGSKVELVDQPDSPLAEAFYSRLVGKTVAQIRKEWTKLILSGQAAAPVACPGDDEVKKHVAASPNAIGYIATSSLDASVREIGQVTVAPSR